MSDAAGDQSMGRWRIRQWRQEVSVERGRKREVEEWMTAPACKAIQRCFFFSLYPVSGQGPFW